MQGITCLSGNRHTNGWKKQKIRWLIWSTKCWIIRKFWQDWHRMTRILASGLRETGHSSIENRRKGYDCRNLS